MTQTKRESLVEAGVGTAIGFVIAWVANWALWRLFGMKPSWAESFWIAVFFTVISVGRVYFVRRLFNWWNHYTFTWDRWIANDIDATEDQIVLRIKHLIHIKSLGWRLDLHKISRADGENCFHTHPANAIRLVIWGGYEEEVLEQHCCVDGTADIEFFYDDNCRRGCTQGAKAYTYRQTWGAWSSGYIAPEFCHRISRLLKGPSYSLWFRGKVTHPINLCGVRDGKYVSGELSFNQEEASQS